MRDYQRKPYLFIECKTTDAKNSEFSKEWARMQDDGGQLFSYLQQERSVEFLCLYTSDLIQDELNQASKIKFENYIIDMSDNEKFLKDEKKQGYKDAQNVKQLVAVWKNTYDGERLESGIFEPRAQAYDISTPKASLENLHNIDSSTMQKKRHEWATILRANAVGDRGVALNKFMNLLLCKITDELENAQDLHFAWRGKASDTAFELVDRLQKLYQIGMQKFLKQQITYHSQDSIDKAFSKHFKDTSVRKAIYEIFKELKYYSNGDFNFIEVYNKEQFNKNFAILLPMVQNLENVRFTGTQDSNILGDYFESYIHDMPQQEGQYFTPVPLVNFIIYSLPKKPRATVLDFSCGAGHFLTQYAQIHKASKQELEFIGIDKDSRLAKIAKIASFMHSLDSNISANDSLKKGVIKEHSCSVLISNPPYSVDGFLANLNEDDCKDYELFSNSINTDTNDQIQCFFIEKAAKALQDDGFLALVLPNPILSKTNATDIKTREILLRDFDIIALCEFGNQTFFKTGTQPIILFALKKPQKEPTQTRESDIFEDFVRLMNEGKFEDISKIYDNFTPYFEAFCEFRGFDKDELKALFTLNLQENSPLLQSETFKDYSSACETMVSKERATYAKKSTTYKDKNPFAPSVSFESFVINKESEKFLYFCYCFNSYPIIIKAPQDSTKQQKFLGFKYSNTKGQQGIQYLPPATSINSIVTPLYNPANCLDKSKLNYYILQNFNSQLEHNLNLAVENNQIPPELTQYAFKTRLVDMIDFKRAEFNKAISLNSNTSQNGGNVGTANPFANSKFELVKLGKILKSGGKGKRPAAFADKNGVYPFVKSSKFIEKCSQADFDMEALIIGDGGGANVHYFNGKFSCSDHTYIYTNDNNEIVLKFFYEVINANLNILEAGFKGIALKNIAKSYIDDIQLPKPPREIQLKIVAECEEIDKKEQNIKSLIKTCRECINAILIKCGVINSQEMPNLEDYFSVFERLTQTLSSLEFSEFDKENSILNEFNKANSNQGIEFNKAALNSSKEVSKEKLRLNLNTLKALIKALPTPPAQGWEKQSLSDNQTFTLQIGERVLDSELSPQGKIPVYSANVLKPFGFVDKELLNKLENYDKDSVLWGIDGDWMVGFVPKNTPFYPTDHCGVLRVKNDSVKAKILQFVLENEGAKVGFKRTLRASIERVKALKLPLPPLNEQEKIIKPIEELENAISTLNATADNLAPQKAKILQKYLF